MLTSILNFQKCQTPVPYHEMGKYKWKELGLKYELENIKIPNDADCKRIHDYLTN